MFQSVINKIKDLFSSSDTGKQSNRSGVNGTQYEGVIVYFNHRKGYGFVKSPAVEDRVFLHVSELSGKASKGRKVRFDAEKSDDGIRAVRAEILD